MSYVNHNFVMSIAVKGNEIWAATTAGVLVWDINTKEYRIYTVKDGLLQDDLRRIAIDGQGNVWAGSIGVNKFDGEKWHQYSSSLNNAPVSVISDIVRDDRGILWFSQSGNGLASFNGSLWNEYTLETNRKSVETVGIDNSGTIWIFAYTNWLMHFDGASWITHNLRTTIYKKSVHAIDFDAANNVWLATSIGILVFDGENITKYQTSDGLANDFVSDVRITGDGTKWFTTSGGVSRLKDGA